jgi:hypothetical protein
MSSNIPNRGLIGLGIFTFILVLITLTFINKEKYKIFYGSLMVGNILIIFTFIYYINELVNLKIKLEEESKNIDKIENCPEYWKKTVINNKINCTSKNIKDNISIANIISNEGIDSEKNNIKYKTLEYKNIDLDEINIQPMDNKCNKMYQLYYNYSDNDITSKTNLKDKNDITWLDYHNNCLKTN